MYAHGAEMLDSNTPKLMDHWFLALFTRQFQLPNAIRLLSFLQADFRAPDRR